MLFFQSFQLFALQGESSYPYLSGYTWGFFCDWRLTNHDYNSKPESFDPDQVKLGDILFVDHSCLEVFARDYLPRITNKVILVTSNYGYEGDISNPGRFDVLLKDDKIAAWFVQNIDRIGAEKLMPIAIGIPSKHWPHGDTNLLDKWIPFSLLNKERLIFMYLNFRACPERKDCIEYFTEIGAHFDKIKSYEAYLQDLSESVFVISPPGNGIDCHRTWEALLMGCYPVVKSSTLDPIFEDLPVVIVKDWSEVTQAFLEKKQTEFRGKDWSRDKLYAPYWFQKVREIQNKLRG